MSALGQQSSVLVIQHVPWERPGRIADFLEAAGLRVETRNLLEEAGPDTSGAVVVPNLQAYAGLVIMGGPMGAADYEQYPVLKLEAQLVRTALKLGLPTLGVCLGHQIIAVAAGASLRRAARPEIGFHEITRAAAHPFLPLEGQTAHVLGWHGDEVGLPGGATLLASSATTVNQAFACGSALGLQFHLEVDQPLLDQWLSTPAMVESMTAAEIVTIRAAFQANALTFRGLGDAVFSAFAGRCLAWAQN